MAKIFFIKEKSIIQFGFSRDNFVISQLVPLDYNQLLLYDLRFSSHIHTRFFPSSLDSRPQREPKTDSSPVFPFALPPFFISPSKSQLPTKKFDSILPRALELSLQLCYSTSHVSPGDRDLHESTWRRFSTPVGTAFHRLHLRL
jgi:hypothetical protein